MSRVVLFALIALLLRAQAPQREADLARQAERTADPHEQIVILHDWMTKYPHSLRRQQRFELLLRAEERLGRTNEMLETARQMAEDAPHGLGSYWLCRWVVDLRVESPALLDAAKRSAAALLVAPGSRRDRARNQIVAHRAAGWVALMRSDYSTAEREFSAVLKRDPRDGEVSYWLGSSYLAEKQSDKALYHLTRSMEVNGNRAVAASVKQQLRPFLERLYQDVRGTSDGFDAFRRTTLARTFP